MKLYFVRHGHTNYNRFGIINDDPSVNVHLTNIGKKQANYAADTLRKVELDYIYVSELPRTLETAEIINKHHRLKIQKDKRINDNRTGYNGLPWLVRWFTFRLAKDPYSKRFRDGESLEDSRVRIFEFLDEIKKIHTDDSVLIVGHANTGWVIKGYMSKSPLTKMFRGHIVNGHVLEYEL